MKRSSSELWPAMRKLVWTLGLSMTVLLTACSNTDSDDDDTPPAGGGQTTQCSADSHCAPAP